MNLPADSPETQLGFEGHTFNDDVSNIAGVIGHLARANQLAQQVDPSGDLNRQILSALAQANGTLGAVIAKENAKFIIGEEVVDPTDEKTEKAVEAEVIPDLEGLDALEHEPSVIILDDLDKQSAEIIEKPEDIEQSSEVTYKLGSDVVIISDGQVVVNSLVYKVNDKTGAVLKCLLDNPNMYLKRSDFTEFEKLVSSKSRGNANTLFKKTIDDVADLLRSFSLPVLGFSAKGSTSARRYRLDVQLAEDEIVTDELASFEGPLTESKPQESIKDDKEAGEEQKPVVIVKDEPAVTPLVFAQDEPVAPPPWTGRMTFDVPSRAKDRIVGDLPSEANEELDNKPKILKNVLAPETEDLEQSEKLAILNEIGLGEGADKEQIADVLLKLAPEIIYRFRDCKNGMDEKYVRQAVACLRSYKIFLAEFIDNDESIVRAEALMRELVSGIVEYSNPVILSIANQNYRPNTAHTAEDLYIEGVIGLLTSIQRFDLRKKSKVFTYCAHRISGAMVDEIRANGSIIRHNRTDLVRYLKLQKIESTKLTDDEKKELDELTDKLRKVSPVMGVYLNGDGEEVEVIEEVPDDLSIDEMVELIDEDKRFLEAFYREVDKIENQDPANSLAKGPRNADVIRMRLGMYPYERSHSQAVIARKINVTESRVAQLLSKILPEIMVRARLGMN